jgi:FAD/FMN-containing dehydrogenase
VDDYHPRLDARLGAPCAGSEMITEANVPRERLTDFMEACREDFRQHAVEFIYGTIRLIERDDDSFLAWAREPWACVVFNLHVTHDAARRARAAEDFRRIIERALERGGSFFLTYHRWATREQVRAAHPRFVDLLRAKLRLDPEGRFQSEWYRHSRELFAAEL